MIKIKVKKLHIDAKLPKFQHDGDVCADLYALNAVTIVRAGVEAIPTGIALEIPVGYEGQIRPRSGLALNSSLGVLNSPGTIDSGYRGEIKVIMFDTNKQGLDYWITKGQRIAQIAIREVPEVEFVEVKTLSKTDRGDDGFGSTGK